MAKKGKKTPRVNTNAGVNPMRAPARNTLSSQVRSAGSVLTSREAQTIAKDTGKTVAQVMARAQDKGVALGAALVNQFNAGKLGVNTSNLVPVIGNLSVAPGQNKATTQALQTLAPLANLQMNKGTAYYGYSTTNTPSQQTRTVNGGGTYTPASTTYNPIVLPRNTGTGSNTGSGANAGNGNGNKNDPYQDLRDQIDAAQQTINDLQNKQVDPYPNLDELIAQQQAQAAAQQEAMAAQAAQQQQALRDLMIQQQQAYETQMADARRQQEAMAAQAAEAQRQAMAVANARVPGLEPTATAPALGDGRKATRTAATNTLSNLAILTGLGTSGGVTATPAASTATPLAGLQIA